MPDGGERFISTDAQRSISDVLSEASLQQARNPFLNLGSFKPWKGNCLGKRGWHPSPIVLSDEAEEVRAFAPAFVKTNSWGEYVFDHTWADAYMRSGANYYPKLQIAIPFTPASGRLLGNKNALLHEIADITTSKPVFCTYYILSV